MDESIAEVACERYQGACCEASLFFTAVSEEKDIT